MYLIVGLGNPDESYQETRHNVGFRFLDVCAKEIKADDFEWQKKLEAKVAAGKFNNQKVILAKPRTYVNNSGLAVEKIKKFYKLKNEQIIVVHDDLDVPFGLTKLTPESGAGGHRGVQSILDHLQTEKVYRLKIGIGNSKLKLARSQPSDQKRKAMISNLVLSNFTPSEKKQLQKIFQEGVTKIEQLVS